MFCHVRSICPLLLSIVLDVATQLEVMKDSKKIGLVKPEK